MKDKLWKIVDFFSKHIIIRITLICVFPFWFSFGNSYLGSALKITNVDGLTPKGWIINIVVFVVYLIFTIIVGFIPKRNEDLLHKKEDIINSYKDTLSVNEKLIEITTDLCSRKLSKISENINQSQKNIGINAFSPIDHLNEISYNIRNCVSYITGIPQKKITVSMLYKLTDSDNWHWTNQSDLCSNSRYNAKELVNDKDSTFNYVLNGETFVVFNDKLKASEQHRYKLDDNDNSHKKVGSIACQKILIPVNADTEYITVLLSISTYGHRFVESYDDNKENNNDVEHFTKNLRDKILSQFTKRISLELLTLYLQTYKSTNKFNQIKTVTT